MILTTDGQVHPDTHALTRVNNVIAVINYVIAARPSPLNFVIADNQASARTGRRGRSEPVHGRDRRLTAARWPGRGR